MGGDVATTGYPTNPGASRVGSAGAQGGRPCPGLPGGMGQGRDSEEGTQTGLTGQPGLECPSRLPLPLLDWQSSTPSPTASPGLLPDTSSPC